MPIRADIVPGPFVMDAEQIFKYREQYSEQPCLVATPGDKKGYLQCWVIF